MAISSKDVQDIRNQLGEVSRLLRDVSSSVHQHKGIEGKKASSRHSLLTPATSGQLSFAISRRDHNSQFGGSFAFT